MDANIHHKEALIEKLIEIQESIRVSNRCIIKTSKDDSVKHWHEVDLWLLERQKELIKEALIHDEIKDF